MSHTRRSYADAVRDANERTESAKRDGRPYRYEARRYPNGTDDHESWPWGVAELQTNYYTDKWATDYRDRFVGFVWEPNK